MERVTVAEAAKRLELTQEAVRQRIRRGTIEYEKDNDGKTYVYLTAEEADTNTVDKSVVKDYINALKSQIASVEQDRDEWREEARRKDHIIMALTQRIPELEAAPDERDSPVTASKSDGKGDVPQEPVADEIRQSWWRRIFQ